MGYFVQTTKNNGPGQSRLVSDFLVECPGPTPHPKLKKETMHEGDERGEGWGETKRTFVKDYTDKDVFFFSDLCPLDISKSGLQSFGKDISRFLGYKIHMLVLMS